jgi:hypothetical protein
LTDPFLDDPTPPASNPADNIPTPMPESTKDVRQHPVWNSPYAARPTSQRQTAATARTASPYKIVSGERTVVSSRTSAAPARGGDVTGRRSTASQGMAEQSVLRRASLEVEEAQYSAVLDAAPAPPALLPLEVRKASHETDIPVNPLR